MQEQLELILGYVRGIWRFRWYIYLLAWPISLAGWYVVSQMPDQYESSAKVFVDTSSALRPLLRGLAVQADVEDGLSMMTRTLMSRSNLEKIARMTDMDLAVDTPEQMGALVSKLRRKIGFSGGSDHLYSISYSDTDPALAKNIVQAMLTVFVESTLGDTRKDSDTARKFINEQVEEYEEKLKEAENRLKEFKRKNLGLMPNQGVDYYRQLSSANEALKAVELQLREFENSRNELQRQLSLEAPVLASSGEGLAFSGAMLHPLDPRIQSLEVSLDDLLFKYTEKHPDVVSTKETLNRLIERKRKDLEALPDDDGTTPTVLNQNPVYQQLKIRLGEAEANVALIGPRVSEYRSNVRRLESLVDTIPQIEADLKNLNRDYAINKKNYEALLARRESARLSERADSSTDNVKFKIIEPPRQPFAPTGPNRPVFYAAALVVSLGAGIALAFLLAMFRPVFDAPKTLQTSTGLPVLGTVSRAWTVRERRNKLLNIVSFLTTGAVLAGVFGLVLVFEMKGIDFVSKIQSLI